MIDNDIATMILSSKTIAVIGISSKPEKAANKVPQYLQNNGYKIIPVNPFSDEILGEKTYKQIQDVNQPVDIVQIFRPSDETPEIVKQAVKIKPKLIWLQLGIKNEGAKEIAENHAIKFVMDHCLMVEHGNLVSDD